MIREAIEHVLAGNDLDRSTARAVMDRLMSGEVSPVRIAALLMALRAKGESVAEITGFAEAMRGRAERVTLKRGDAVDTCGTGGDGGGTFNISTAAAFVAAGAGAAVAKHGNRAVSSRSGSADVLEALGVNLNISPVRAGALIDEIGLGFLFAPAHHPAMKHVAPVRRELGLRTVFNVLGPLTNPAGVKRQVIGVFAGGLCEPLARVLAELGAERAFVVHGQDGLDEVSLTSPTLVAELRDGEVKLSTFQPEDMGLTLCSAADLTGGTPEQNATILTAILDGEKGPRTDAVLLNAAFALTAAGVVDGVADGLNAARDAVADGRAACVLSALREATNNDTEVGS